MRSLPHPRALLAACLLAGLQLGEASARPAAGALPWTTLLVVASGPASEREAARVYRTGRMNLERTRTLVFVNADAVLAGQKPDADPMVVVRELFEKGRRAYDNLELQQAIVLLRSATAEMNKQLALLEDLDLFTDIHIYLGAALELLGKQQDGRAVFRRLLVINPGAEIDPVVFPPALAAVFKQARSQVRQAGTGSWNVEASLGGTEVWIDGVFRGISPVRIENLVEGGHLLQLFRRGCYRLGGVFEVVANSEELIQQEPQPLPGLARLGQLEKRLVQQAPGTGYPPAAHELLDWLNADRLIFLVVEVLGDTLVVRAHYFDREARRCIKAREKSFDPLDEAFGQRLDLFITSLYMDVEGQEIATAGTVKPPVALPVPPLPEDLEDNNDGDKRSASSGGILTTWWFWTVAGLVVAGGTGLVLALTLEPDQRPTDGEVVFRF